MQQRFSAALAVLAVLFLIPGMLAVSSVGFVLMFAPASAVGVLFGGMVAAVVGAVLLMFADSI